MPDLPKSIALSAEALGVLGLAADADPGPAVLALAQRAAKAETDLTASRAELTASRAELTAAKVETVTLSQRVDSLESAHKAAVEREAETELNAWIGMYGGHVPGIVALSVDPEWRKVHRADSPAAKSLRSVWESKPPLFNSGVKGHGGDRRTVDDLTASQADGELARLLNEAPKGTTLAQIARKNPALALAAGYEVTR